MRSVDYLVLLGESIDIIYPMVQIVHSGTLSTTVFHQKEL